MYKVYISDYVFADLEPEKEVLGGIAEVVPLQCKTPDELIARAGDADALLNTYLDGIDGKVMDAMKNLKVIVRYGIGVNTIDVDAATARGIKVANVPEYCIDAVSDHALALTLDCVRKTTLSTNRIRKGEYTLSYVNPIKPLRGAYAGILGFGRIGKAIAGKLSGFGCDIHFFDPFIPGDLEINGINFKKASLEEICSNAEIIIVQAPLTKENIHLLGKKQFELMTKKPVIVNTARGELVDTEALTDALEKGVVSAAGLDVWEGNPPLDAAEKLKKFENVILTPHSAWVSGNSLRQLQYFAAQEAKRVLSGKPLKHIVNPEVLK